jgi:hypothetical protein
MSFRIVKVNNRRTWRDFLSLPFQIYKKDPNWVAPISTEVRRLLDQHRNPYFTDAKRELFLCYKNDTPIARAVAVVNPNHWKKFDEKTAFFGFFESYDDNKVTEYLFEALENHCRREGAEWLEGPFNPNHYNELGLLVGNFDRPPSFFQPYNPSYYMCLLEHIGFQVSRRLHTRSNHDISDYIQRRYGQSERSNGRHGFTLRNVNTHDFTVELERIREIYNDAFSDNWHFLPLSRDEYIFSAKFLRLISKPELIAIVEKDEEPVAVLQCVLDINPILQKLNGRASLSGYFRLLAARRHIRNLIIFAIGIKKAYQRTHAFKLLHTAMCSMARKYQSVETTWMSEDNRLAIRAAELIGLQPDRQFAIYRKRL